MPRRVKRGGNRRSLERKACKRGAACGKRSKIWKDGLTTIHGLYRKDLMATYANAHDIPDEVWREIHRAKKLQQYHHLMNDEKIMASGDVKHPAMMVNDLKHYCANLIQRLIRKYFNRKYPNGIPFRLPTMEVYPDHKFITTCNETLETIKNAPKRDRAGMMKCFQQKVKVARRRNGIRDRLRRKLAEKRRLRTKG